MKTFTDNKSGENLSQQTSSSSNVKGNSSGRRKIIHRKYGSIQGMKITDSNYTGNIEDNISHF